MVPGQRLASSMLFTLPQSDDSESHVAVRLRALEARISASPAVAGAVLSLSAPDDPTLAA
jgi:hypothetical protein